jgi:hypothetical protein
MKSPPDDGPEKLQSAMRLGCSHHANVSGLLYMRGERFVLGLSRPL